MPWVLVFRWLVRAVVGLAFWRLATARRGAYATNGPRVRRGPAPPRIDPRVAAAAVRRGAALGWRVASALVFLLAAAVLVTAGVTTSVLSPRWLGGLLLALAVVALTVTALEARAALSLLRQWRRFRRDQELRRTVS